MENFEAILRDVSLKYPEWDKEWDLASKENKQFNRYTQLLRFIGLPFLIPFLIFMFKDEFLPNFWVFLCFLPITFFVYQLDKITASITNTHKHQASKLKAMRTTFNSVKLETYLLEHGLQAQALFDVLQQQMAQKQKYFDTLSRSERYEFVLDVIQSALPTKNVLKFVLLWCKKIVVYILLKVSLFVDFLEKNDNRRLREVIKSSSIVIYPYKLLAWIFTALYKFCQYIAIFFEKKISSKRTNALIPFSFILVVLGFLIMIRLLFVKSLKDFHHFINPVVLFAALVFFILYSTIRSDVKQSAKRLINVIAFYYLFYFWVLVYYLTFSGFIFGLVNEAFDIYGFAKQDDNAMKQQISHTITSVAIILNAIFKLTIIISLFGPLLLSPYYLIYRDFLQSILAFFSIQKYHPALRNYIRIEEDLKVLIRAEFLQSVKTKIMD